MQRAEKCSVSHASYAYAVHKIGYLSDQQDKNQKNIAYWVALTKQKHSGCSLYMTERPVNSYKVSQLMLALTSNVVVTHSSFTITKHVRIY